jgi:plastocyanin
MRSKLLQLGFGILLTGIMSAAGDGRAATTMVSVGTFWFNPTNISVNVGDSVLWTNVSLIGHDSTGRAGLWSSPTLSSRSTYRLQFTNAGVFPYFCQLHILSHPEQTGTVSVVSAGPPTAVTLTRPRSVGDDFTFSFSTQEGKRYEVQRTPSLPAAQWEVVTNLTGSGGEVSVANRKSAAPAYYRVESK